MKISPMNVLPRFGERVKIDPEEAFKSIGVSTAASTGAPLVTATSVGGSATGTVGSGLQTGGTGLSSTGPQSSAAKLTLDAMNSVGSGGAAQWSVANPSLGGLAQFIVGSLLGGGGGSASSSSSKKMNSPS